MTACPPDQGRPLRRVSDEEVSLAQHVGHDTAVDDRLSWRAADTGAALERPCTQKRYIIIISSVLNKIMLKILWLFSVEVRQQSG